MLDHQAIELIQQTAITADGRCVLDTAKPTALTYAGLPFEDFRMRLSIITGDDKPVFVLRIVREQELRERIAQEFKRVLLADLDGKAGLTIGSYTLT